MIHNPSPGSSPSRDSSPTARVARVSATSMRSATTVPVSRFLATNGIQFTMTDALRASPSALHPWHPCTRGTLHGTPGTPGTQIYFFMLSIIGNSTVMNLIAAGPMVTTQIAGKMQNTSGNTIFTPVFAAASSAR